MKSSLGKVLKVIWEIIKSIIPIIIIVLIIRTFIIGLYEIPSASMKPGLIVGDVLFATKYSYGYSRYDFPPPLRNILPKGRIFNRTPNRGDVIVFKTPNDPCQFSLKDKYKRQCRNFIKRLVGLPGDTIQVLNGKLYINNQPVLVENLVKKPYRFYDDGEGDIDYYFETTPEGYQYIQRDENPNGELDHTKKFIVPDGYYFFMGDNRDNSADSRLPVPYGIGMVSQDKLLARARFLIYSKNSKSKTLLPWTWLNLRTDRFFKAIK